MSVITELSLQDVQNRYPSGVYSARHGCYYFVDYDGDLGYFIGLANGNFDSESGYVDIDTLDEELAEECKSIAAHIAIQS